MTRTLGLLGLLTTAFAVAADAPKPIPASEITLENAATVSDVLARIDRQMAIKVEPGVLDPKAKFASAGPTPFWKLLDRIAADTNTRLVVNGSSKAISFAPGRPATAASIHGAFRIASAGVTARTDAADAATYTLALDVQWEPRFPVFRIDAQPRVTAAADDRGQKLSAPTASVKSAVVGYSHTTDVRIDGLTREAKRIAKFAGEFTVTAAPKMLAFAFDDFAKLPATKEIDGVKATLAKILKRDEVWELQLTVEYPAAPPSFESFESWTNRNAIRLVAPNKTQAIEVENSDVTATGRTVQAAYRFLHKNVDFTNRKGWSVVYETPAPLVEFPVRFELKDIKLP
jgi:hypothetical protein